MPGHSAGNSGSHNKKQKWPSNGPSPAKRTRGLANTPDDPRPRNRVWLGEPSRPKEKLPGKTNYFFKLPMELHLQILKCLHGEDILSLRETSLRFYGVLQDPSSARFWDVIRKDSGIILAENRPPLPTLDEIRLAKYVLQSHCMGCKVRGAYPQWAMGFRLCEICLASRVISNYAFNKLYGDTFNKKDQAKDAIGWFYPDSIPGVEACEVSCISAPRKWAIAAAERVKTQLRANPKASYMEVGNEVASWLKETRSFCSNNLKSCVVPDRSNEAAFNRLARQRQRWLSGFILRLAPLKFVPEDIPTMDETDGWGRFVYKSVAAGTFEEWDENETRLLSIVKNRRNARLSPLLQGKQPPAACDGRLEQQISPDTSVIQIGPFTCAIFLKICSMTNMKTLAILEQVSCSAKDILRSPLADDVWRQARASIGLKSKFPGWTERSFVHYAINRTCTYCSSEGLTLWAFAATMCGDCFGRRVMDLRDVSAVFSGPIRDSVPSVRAALFCSAAWVTGVKRDSLLVSKDYLEAVQTWATSFPDYARNMIPEDEFGRHIRIQNAQFMKVAEDGIKWQRDRDRRRDHLKKSRENFIANKLQARIPPLHASHKVRRSSQWEAIVDKQYTLSELEWNRIERSVLDILGVH